MKRKSFTLIEMLVTIAIITIITATSVAGLKGYKTRSYFNEAVSQVHGEVLKAQSLALASGKADATGYKVTFSGSNYTIKQVGGVDEGSTLDSGSISSNVTVTNLEITFTKDGSSTGGAIDITDPSGKFTKKTITVTLAGSVELK